MMRFRGCLLVRRGDDFSRRCVNRWVFVGIESSVTAG